MEFKMRLDKKSYDIGFEAGKKLEECIAPENCDELSFFSGYIEGKAEADKNTDRAMESESE